MDPAGGGGAGRTAGSWGWASPAAGPAPWLGQLRSWASSVLPLTLHRSGSLSLLGGASFARITSVGRRAALKLLQTLLYSSDASPPAVTSLSVRHPRRPEPPLTALRSGKLQTIPASPHPPPPALGGRRDRPPCARSLRGAGRGGGRGRGWGGQWEAVGGAVGGRQEGRDQ